MYRPPCTAYLACGLRWMPCLIVHVVHVTAQRLVDCQVAHVGWLGETQTLGPAAGCCWIITMCLQRQVGGLDGEQASIRADNWFCGGE